jgi:hypothetical protein
MVQARFATLSSDAATDLSTTTASKGRSHRLDMTLSVSHVALCHLSYSGALEYTASVSRFESGIEAKPPLDLALRCIV